MPFHPRSRMPVRIERTWIRLETTVTDRAPKPVVAIVGRPNVGKSTLFNRLVGARISIVEPEPGVTRDRITADCTWRERAFTVIDTGGIETDPTETLIQAARHQAELAMEAADLILFVVDARVGLTDADYEVADILRRRRKQVLLVVNKIDNPQLQAAAYEFYSVGLGDPIPISAEHGRGVGDLLDGVLEALPEAPAVGEQDEAIRVAVVGRPNVGKSSLVNTILGEVRVIVSDIPGTTRDAVDTAFRHDGREFILVDTAGLRRPSKVELALEKYSVVRAKRAIDRCDVALLVLDATAGVTEQDQRISGEIVDAGRGIVILVNKWDLVEKQTGTLEAQEAEIRKAFPHLSYAPITFISAKTGRRVPDVLALAEAVAEQHALRITTGRLNDIIQQAIQHHAPPSDKGVQFKIYYAVQASVKPPTFILFVNRPSLMHFSYQRYLENRLREAFAFTGTPIVIEARSRRRS